MNWLFWLGLAVVLTGFAAVTGFKSRGTRPVAGSRLMGVGRFLLLLMIIIVAYMAYRARFGP